MSNTDIYSNPINEDTVEEVEVPPRQLTLEEKVDLIGEQLNWLCENLSQLFGLVQGISTNGGGVRGLMKMMKELNNSGNE